MPRLHLISVLLISILLDKHIAKSKLQLTDQCLCEKSSKAASV